VRPAGVRDHPRLGRRRATGRLGVRANADTGSDAANAGVTGPRDRSVPDRAHVPGEDRLPIVRRMILADTPTRVSALEELRVAQRPTSRRSSRPWTASRDHQAPRPALHEFLPDTQDLAIKEATVGLDEEESRLYEAPSVARVQPDARTRGSGSGDQARLYAMQVRA